MKFWGKVRTKSKRGKSLGFPTANVNLSKNIPEGIYLSITKVGGEKYYGLTFIGAAKTFNEKKIQAETYILDFNQNLYGKWISVEAIKKIRQNKKFSSSDNLINQMRKDEQEAREFFKSQLDDNLI